ncbi:prostatic acid phosphatase-like, partial [Amazona ochrocephala]
TSGAAYTILLLPQLGIQQQYELGQYMRRRYSNFLSVVYKQCEASTVSGRKDVFIYVQSTDCDYTLTSAQASLAGLYPPTQDQIWNPGILWQPIPVHTVPLSHDRPFLKFLATHTGYPLKKLNSERIWKLSDTLQHEDTNNYSVPVWATHGVRTKLTKLSELLLQAEFGFYKQIQKSRLQGGILLKTILKHISDARKPSHQQKMVMYSAVCAIIFIRPLMKGFFYLQHAATIAALQMALNVFNGKLPPYSACHFFELYQEKNGQVSASWTENIKFVPNYYPSILESRSGSAYLTFDPSVFWNRQYTIEMYYRNNTQRDPHPLTLPGCKFRCPLERFTQLVSPVLVHYWTRECRM